MEQVAENKCEALIGFHAFTGIKGIISFDLKIVNNLIKSSNMFNKKLVNFSAFVTMYILLTFLGCDSTSSFYGRSKITSWNIVSGDQTSIGALGQVGNDFNIDETLEMNLESLTCKLYKAKNTTFVDETRHNMFKMGKFSDAEIRTAFQSIFSMQITRQQHGKDQQHL